MRKLVVLSLLAASILASAQQSGKKPGVAITPPANLQVGQAFEHQILVLDGLRCNNCSFKNLTLLYSGGPYELKNATFSGAIAIEFHGVAENGLFTVAALSSAEPEPRKVLKFDTPKTLSLRNTW